MDLRVESGARWNSRAFEAGVIGRVSLGLELAGTVLRDDVRALISTPYPPPSAPGEPPHLRTGNLRESYTHVVERSYDPGPTLYVGSNVRQARYLEYGTSRMAPRPHLRAAWWAFLPRALDLICTRL
jgi:hypothetical protein